MYVNTYSLFFLIPLVSNSASHCVWVFPFPSRRNHTILKNQHWQLGTCFICPPGLCLVNNVNPFSCQHCAVAIFQNLKKKHVVAFRDALSHLSGNRTKFKNVSLLLSVAPLRNTKEINIVKNYHMLVHMATFIIKRYTTSGMQEVICRRYYRCWTLNQIMKNVTSKSISIILV